MQKADLVLRVAGVLGAVKVALDAFNMPIISDADVNLLANAAGTLLAIIAAGRAAWKARQTNKQ
jgi:hypothetical protein